MLPELKLIAFMKIPVVIETMLTEHENKLKTSINKFKNFLNTCLDFYQCTFGIF